MSRLRVGIGVRLDGVVAAGMHAGHVDWRDQERRVDDEPLADCIARLISRLPRARLGTLHIVAALSPAFVQLRSFVNGVDDDVDVESIRAKPERYFLRAAGRLVIADCHPESQSWWTAAYDDACLDGVRDGCNGGRAVVDGFVPTIVGISYGVKDGIVEWQDGEVVAAITWRAGELVTSRRTLRTEPTELVPGRTAESDPFADAIAAARCGSTTPLMLPNHERIHAGGRRRRLVLGVLAAVSVIGALIAPDVAIQTATVRVRQELGSARAATSPTAALVPELRLTTTTLQDVARFHRTTMPMLRLLSSIATALPESTVLLSVHADSIAGELSAVSLQAGALVDSLATLSVIRDVQLAGPLTHEQMRGKDVQRIGLRFRLARSVAFPGPREQR